ncbi:hypothetical protein JQ633_27240 [Bradyrhizobium tropiciagri]|uniref:LuxR C-terminal-related transcriptional regulator n=1 Tax=Bradyrhizobium tropiciagri TaxID=312253 RepID=UPI001BA88F3F|nr:LuxR C-terminal-related transcriptional regulator [Bradyrhizobium tropiciagri]MBR0874082.1 hypothetical protein [Bradyrhizobium tropiciagri]
MFIHLSTREKRLLRRIAAGKTDKQISISVRGTLAQVSEQRFRLFEKLGIRTDDEIAEVAALLAYLPQYKGTS